MKKRPLSLILVGCVFIATGFGSLIYHHSQFEVSGGKLYETLAVSLVRVSAIVAGVLILRGRNWGRWIAIAWLGFHVAMSAYFSVPQIVTHLVLFAVFGYLLFRPAANVYFNASKKA